MTMRSFTTSFRVARSPAEVFAAINNVRAWWPGTIHGNADALGAEFTYAFERFHVSTQRVSAFVPGRKVVWHVAKSQLNFVRDKGEWDGTDIVFDIEETDTGSELRFSHLGLTPDLQCHGSCSGAWADFVGNSLRDLIESGHGHVSTDAT